MIEKGEIVIPESLSPIELDDIFRTARFKELRIMDNVLNKKICYTNKNNIAILMLYKSIPYFIYKKQYKI